jgi:acetate kinase
VFTGGTGEHGQEIRQVVAVRLGWPGMTIDQELNRADPERIDASGGGVEVYVVPTDEEAVIARQTTALLAE